MRVLLVVLAVTALGAAAILLLAWWGHERLVWQPPRAAPGFDDAADVRRASYTATDGQPLHGYLVMPARPTPAGVLLAFHGNAETAANVVPWARALARRTGWAVLATEYRGYGGLPGRPTYEGSRHDARAAHQWARDSLGTVADRVALFGFSLGSAVAAELAAELGVERVAVLVLEAPFTSTHEMARLIAPGWVAAAWPWIGRVPYDTRRRVAEVDVPVWVVHGDADGVIPVRMGRAVHAAARRPGGLLVVRGADHGAAALVDGAGYWAFVTRALASVGTGPSPPAP
jgi:pimeloyl-ACP methyl ester carboxylesterase